MTNLTDIQLWGSHAKKCGHALGYWCACNKHNPRETDGTPKPMGQEPQNRPTDPVRPPDPGPRTIRIGGSGCD